MMTSLPSPPKSTAHIHSSLFGSYFYLPPLHSTSPSPTPTPTPTLTFLLPSSATPILKSHSETASPSSPETSGNMLLGKRPRPPMKRTTSLSEIPFDLNVAADAPQTDPNHNHNPNGQPPSDLIRSQPGGYNWMDQRVSPTNHRRHSVDFVETADFLRACFLCKRRLVPGRDIYMYRGDSAFCSLECRQKQMVHDERKEKRCMVSNKQVVAQPSESQVTNKGESVAAL